MLIYQVTHRRKVLPKNSHKPNHGKEPRRRVSGPTRNNDLKAPKALLPNSEHGLCPTPSSL